MKKNTALAIILSMIVIFAYMYIQQRFFPAQELPAPQNIPDKVLTDSSIPLESAIQNNQTFAISNDVEEDNLLTKQQYEIETKLVKVIFSNKGGDIISYKLKEYSSAGGKGFIEMIKNVKEENRAFSLSLGAAFEKPLDILFDVKQKTSEDGSQSIVFFRNIKITDSDGKAYFFKLAKEYVFLNNDYMFTLNILLENGENTDKFDFNGAAYTIRTAPQIGPEWIQDNDRYEYRKFAEFSNGKMREIKKIKSGQTKASDEISQWTSVYGKYFALVVLPAEPIQKALYSMEKLSSNSIPNSQIFITKPPINANKYTDSYKIYIGPNSDKFLSRYNLPINNPHEINNAQINMIAASGGLLRPLEWILKFFLENIYKLIPNWGVSILVLTLLMRIIFFPLTKKSSRATRKMQAMQPEIKSIQEKYKGNPQKLNAEMAKFYKETGHNPLSGCLPMLIQLPFLFAMYRLFNNYFEFRGASFIPGWIPDLSVGDSIWQFGTKIPILGWTDLRLLPLIYLVSQIVYGKITQMPNQENTSQSMNMNMMIYFMPIFFCFMFYNAPSGLFLFWTATNFLMLVQQIIINKALDKEENMKSAKRK